MTDNNIFKEKQPLILMVDDVPKNLQVLGSTLSRENYKIAVANSGEQAILIANDICSSALSKSSSDIKN